MAEHALSAVPTHSRWNAELAPRLTIDAGDTVHFECQDSSGAQVGPTTTVQEFEAIDRGRIHALTGPVAIAGAMPGDVLQVDVLEVQHKGWGWSSVIPTTAFPRRAVNCAGITLVSFTTSRSPGRSNDGRSRTDKSRSSAPTASNLAADRGRAGW